MKGIKIVYVEDESALGFIVKESLSSRGFEVFLCKNATEGLAAYRTHKPEICVLDVMMPGMNGFDMATEIRKTDKATPIIFVTARSQTEDVVNGFKLGGNDYLKKPFSIEELIVRIEAILDREHLLQQGTTTSVFRIGQYVFNSGKQELNLGDSQRKLTHRESEILKMLCQQQNSVLEKDAVLMKLWGDNNFFNSRSMDVFITKLRKYLNKDKAIEIVNVRGKGYKLII